MSDFPQSEYLSRKYKWVTLLPINMSAMPRLPVKEETRDKARVTKAKLGMTWDEFVKRASEELDPDTDTDD